MIDATSTTGEASCPSVASVVISFDVLDVADVDSCSSAEPLTACARSGTGDGVAAGGVGPHPNGEIVQTNNMARRAARTNPVSMNERAE